jgi:hypothetical protein
VTSKKLTHSLALATSYLDQLLDNFDEYESPPKIQKKNKFTVISSIPTSNTIN